MNNNLQVTPARDPLELTNQWRAKVESLKDLDGQMRVQVRLVGLWDAIEAKDLPWAEYDLPIGARAGEGAFVPVEVGDLVWVDFPNGGDTRYPRILSGCHYAPNGRPNLPPQAFGEEAYQHKRRDGQPVPAPPVYHEHIVFSRFGFLAEIGKGGDGRLTHMASGTAIEITTDGDLVLHGEKDVYRDAGGRTLEQSTGAHDIEAKTLNITVAGPANITAEEDINLKSNAGGVNIECAKPFTVKAPNADMQLG